jgi:hypothetical protein
VADRVEDILPKLLDATHGLSEADKQMKAVAIEQT